MQCAASNSRSGDGAKRRLHVSDAEPRSLRRAVRGTTHALRQARVCTRSRWAARIGRRLIGRTDATSTTRPQQRGSGGVQPTCDLDRPCGRCLQGGGLGVLHVVLISTSGASGATYQGRQCSPVRFGSLGGRGLRPRGARYNISTAMNGSCQSLKAADKVVEGCEPCRTGFALSHIGTGTGLTLATSAPGLGSPLSHLRRDWARPCPHLRREWALPWVPPAEPVGVVHVHAA